MPCNATANASQTISTRRATLILTPPSRTNSSSSPYSPLSPLPSSLLPNHAHINLHLLRSPLLLDPCSYPSPDLVKYHAQHHRSQRSHPIPPGRVFLHPIAQHLHDESRPFLDLDLETGQSDVQLVKVFAGFVVEVFDVPAQGLELEDHGGVDRLGVWVVMVHS
jgi:hypothetical protein